MRQVGRSAGRGGAARSFARTAAGGARRMLPWRLLRAAFRRAGERRKPAPRPRRRPNRGPLQRKWEDFAEGDLVRGQSVAAGGFLAFSLAFAVIMGGHLGALGKGIVATLDGGLAATGLAVEGISVTGLERAKMADIRAALGAERGKSIFSFDADAARARIEQIGWVRSAEVQRLLPNEVLVTIHERQPFAVWQHNGEFAVIDRTGTRLKSLVAADFRHLPQVVGAGAAEGAAAILAEVGHYRGIAGRVDAFVRVAERRWSLYMKSGIEVLLPEGEAAPALAELDKLQADHEILNRDVTQIDFRLADRLTIRLSDEAAERRRENAKAASGSRRKSG